MKSIDARGKMCPLPLIMAKKALGEMVDDDTLEIIIDNETSAKNVIRFLEEHKIKVRTKIEKGDYKLTVDKTGEIPEETRAEDYCELPPGGHADYVIAFQKNTLGTGVDELGQLLIKGFINTLPEINKRPQTLVFLNSGIFLALKDSPVMGSMIRLEKEGVKILVCGTCLDYFGRKDELGVGVISNMYDIINELSNAGKVLYP